MLLVRVLPSSNALFNDNDFNFESETTSSLSLTSRPTLRPQLQTLSPSRSQTAAPSSSDQIISAAPSTWLNIPVNSGQLVTSSDKNFTTMSMVYTFVICVVLFICILVFFEFNRHYKQIFLKRYQKRFIDIGQVPPQPPETR